MWMCGNQVLYRGSTQSGCDAPDFFVHVSVSLRDIMLSRPPLGGAEFFHPLHEIFVTCAPLFPHMRTHWTALKDLGPTHDASLYFSVSVW